MKAARPHRARKRFGQHFLVDTWARKVVAALEPAPGDVFLEIGPGKGALTLPLAATGAPVVAVEIDRDLAASLAARVPPNVTVITGDVLGVDVRPFLTGLQPQRPPSAAPTESVRRRFRAVGNLPYNLSTPILFHLIDLHRRHAFFADATLMLQREVADRLLARVGTKDYGVLTILVRMHASVTRLVNLPPGAFVPAPKVRSTVVRLTFGPPAVKVPDDALFERLVKTLFMQRRKTLANSLKAFDRTGAAVLALSGIDPRRRPETLTLTDLARLTELFATVRRPSGVAS